MLKDHLPQIENGINHHAKTYENFILLGDFKAEISDTNLSSFMLFINSKVRLGNLHITKILTIQPEQI